MERAFYNRNGFNQPLSGWNVGQVTTCYAMFNLASSFNQPLAEWNVGQVTDMGSMFDGAAAFNQPLGDWDTSQVQDMGSMFLAASAFNQDLCKWDIRKVTSMYDFDSGSNYVYDCCDNAKRFDYFVVECVPCENCRKGGKCSNGYDDEAVNCDICPLESFPASGQCLSCSKTITASVFFPLIFLTVLFAIIAIAWFLVKKKIVKLPDFNLDITNMIRIKQLSAVLQVFVVFADLSNLLAPWFRGLSDILSEVSMPFEVNPVCEVVPIHHPRSMVLSDILDHHDLPIRLYWFPAFGTPVSVHQIPPTYINVSILSENGCTHHNSSRHHYSSNDNKTRSICSVERVWYRQL